MGCVESKRRSFNATKYRDRSLNESRIFNPADRSMTEIKRGKLQQLPKKKMTINIEEADKSVSHSRKIQTPQSNLGRKLNQVLETFPSNLKMSSIEHESRRKANNTELEYRHKHSGFEEFKRKTSQFEQSKQKPPVLSTSKTSEPQNQLYYHSIDKPILHSLSTGQLMQDYIVEQRKMLYQDVQGGGLKKIQQIDINIKLEPPRLLSEIQKSRLDKAEPDNSPQPRGYKMSPDTDSTNEKEPPRFRMEELLPVVSHRRPHTTKVIYHKEYFSKTEVRN